MIEDIGIKYIRKEDTWLCKECNGEIYSGKKKYNIVCSCLEKRSQNQIYINHLNNYYELNGLRYICKKCNLSIHSQREKHALSCVGNGTRRNNEAKKFIPANFSNSCDMGCGNMPNFFYKNGKAYCTKFAAKCPVKVEADRLKKIGLNPWQNKEHPKGMLGKNPHNKGLTKETSDVVAKNGLAISKAFTLHGDKRKKKHHTVEVKEKLSKIASDRMLSGSLIPNKQYKRGTYKGFKCDSSWELAYVIYCLEKNIDIQRNKKRRRYIFEGVNRWYIPDFLVNGDIVEIKGYDCDKWKAKLAYNPDIKVLYEDDMKPIIKYAVDKYGKDYIKLYENK